jgi:hypothetical protein
MEPVATFSGAPTSLTLVNWGTGLMLIGRDGRPESMVYRISRFVFALPTKGRLEALRGPQTVATSAEQPHRHRRARPQVITLAVVVPEFGSDRSEAGCSDPSPSAITGETDRRMLRNSLGCSPGSS